MSSKDTDLPQDEQQDQPRSRPVDTLGYLPSMFAHVGRTQVVPAIFVPPPPPLGTRGTAAGPPVQNSTDTTAPSSSAAPPMQITSGMVAPGDNTVPPAQGSPDTTTLGTTGNRQRRAGRSTRTNFPVDDPMIGGRLLAAHQASAAGQTAHQIQQQAVPFPLTRHPAVSDSAYQQPLQNAPTFQQHPSITNAQQQQPQPEMTGDPTEASGLEDYGSEAQGLPDQEAKDQKDADKQDDIRKED